MSLPKGTPSEKGVSRAGADRGTSRGQSPGPGVVFRTSILLQVSFAFLVVLALKWPVLHDPPVWDTAMSVFPAAITLQQYGFDLPRLLEQPSYNEAGPNAHADSVVTWITALIIRVAGRTETFLPLLHLFHFLITALTLVAVYRYSRPMLGDAVSLLSVTATLTFPPFLTQAGYMYLEMPLALTTVLAFLAWQKRGFYQAGLWAMISCWIKPTGILVGAALTGAALLESGSARDRLRRAAVVGLPPLGIVLARMLLLANHLEGPENSIRLSALSCLEIEFFRYLLRVPDLAFLVGLFLLGCGILHRRIWTGLRRQGQADPDSERNHWLALNALAVLSFLAMIYIVAPTTLGHCFGLPRYYVPVLPFVFMSLSFFLAIWTDRKRASALLMVVIGFFIVNRNGIFYPSDVDQHGLFGNNFALTERSGAYRELARIQGEAMRFLERVPRGVPIYFGHHEDYLNRYPAMGYVRHTMPNAVGIMRWDGKRMKQLLANPPECIYFLYNYPWLGGERVQVLVGKLKATHLSETVRIFQSGQYKIIVHRMRAPGSSCRGESE